MNHIHIQGYKSLANVELDIKPINILIGGNGAGKSNFIKFFNLLKAYTEKRLVDFLNERKGLEHILFRGKTNAKELSFEVGFKGIGATISATIRPGFDGTVLVQKAYYLGLKKERENTIYDRIKVGQGNVEEKGNAFLETIKSYHFHDTGARSPFSELSHTENDVYYLYSNGSNIGAYLYHIQKTNRKAYNRIVKNIQSIAPYFLDFFLRPNDGGYIRLQWRDKYSEYVYGVNDLSDGTIRFIALSVLFLQPHLPSVLIIDEPELGLHPVAIAKLAGLIKLAAAKGCKVIAATQSPALVDHFTAEDIVAVDNENGASHFRRLKEDQLNLWLEDYSLGELWERNVIDNAQP